jgi:acyl-CoA reductase-like NAD-dependent aldehyde dehydrogenase
MALTYPLLISNKSHTTSSSFPVHSPSTGHLLHHFSSASISDAEDAVRAAQNAFLAWRSLPPQKKRDIFLATANIMDSRREELQKYMVDETGAEEGTSSVMLQEGSLVLQEAYRQRRKQAQVR